MRSRQPTEKLELAFAPAAPCRGIEVAWFALNPLDEPCHFRMRTQRLLAVEVSLQLGFCKQRMNLLVAGSVHEDGDDTTP